jgi:hypothetical protein
MNDKVRRTLEWILWIGVGIVLVVMILRGFLLMGQTEIPAQKVSPVDSAQVQAQFEDIWGQSWTSEEDFE